jgi:hypothetical protein
MVWMWIVLRLVISIGRAVLCVGRGGLWEKGTGGGE